MKITVDDLKIGNRIKIKDAFSGRLVEVEIKSVDRRGDAYWVSGESEEGKLYVAQYYPA